MSNISSLGKRKPRIVRNWQAARDKCDLEMGCRVCGDWPVEAAHIIGRESDAVPPVRGEDWSPYDVAPDRVVPLCREHHQGNVSVHNKTLDLLPYLTVAEQVQAVSDAQGISRAMTLLMPSESHRRAA